MSEFIIVSTDLPASILEVSTPGPQGSSGTVSVGTVTTGAAGSQADVTNSGTSTDAVLDFVIPKGDTGDVTPELLAAKDAAIASASAAAGSATTASTQATNAANSASAASTSATNAANSATSSANSATSSAASASTASTQAANASSSATNAASSATAAAGSATTATTQASNASTSAVNAAASATAASTSATNAANSASASAASATNAANSATASATSASTASTQATNAANSATASAASATASANSATTASTQATNASTSATNAANSATAASTSATTASTQASNASTSATTASTQAGIATASANAASASAATVATLATNLDLTGVTAQALHRSPNAVTAMFVYDTSKDSDGGAWTEKCQHTSWYNEALNGKWLGAWPSEATARIGGAATLGSNLVTNGGFNTNVSGWTPVNNAVLSWSSGAISVVNSSTPSFGSATQAFTTIVGRTYLLTYSRVGPSGSGGPVVHIGTTSGGTEIFSNNNIGAATFVATATTTYVTLGTGTNTASVGYIYDDVSVREVIAVNTASGDYYQSTVDGKFYRLWKNLLRWSNDFTNAVWAKQGAGTAATSPTTLTFGGSNPYVFQSPPAASTVAGSPLTVSFILSGTGTIQLGGYTLGGNFQVSTVTLTTTPTVYSHTFTPAVGQTDIRFVLGCPIGGTATAVTVGGAQVEFGSVYSGSIETKPDATGTTTETFRGNKADFPRLAGIVAEASNVTIYDLTEAGRPMWMRFDGTSNNSMLRSSAGSIAAFNGEVSVGSTGGWGLGRFNFIKDTSPRHLTIAYRFVGNIAARNNTIGYVADASVGTIASATVNAVAMTVLPDAPVDAVTGLQVPTIAVATGGGVSVIKHNGTVVNSSSTAAHTALTINGQDLYAQLGSQSYVARAIGNLGAAFSWSSPNLNSVSGPSTNWGFTVNPIRTLTKGTIAYVDQARGVSILKDNNTQSKAIGSRIANTFNTGHLIGDIRRAYLADVSAGSVSGPELINTNGFFSATYYADATVSVSGDVVTLVTGSAYNNGGIFGAALVQVSNLVVGKTYALTITVPSNVGISLFSNASGSGQIGPDLLWNAGAGTFTFLISPTVTMLYVGVKKQASNATVVFSKPSLQIREYDRSYKAASAPITGTLTKTQVAAAAQLVAYSGFSAANYLREPYSVDLDFGTGEWSASAWVNVPVTLPVGSFPVTGNELTNNSNWVAFSGSGVSVLGTTVTVSDSTGTNGYQRAYQDITTVAGKWYLFSGLPVSTTDSRNTLALNIWNGTFGSIIFSRANLAPGSLFSGAFLATGTTTRIDLVENDPPNTTSRNWVWDNVTVKELNPALVADRAHSSGPKINLGVDVGGRLTATAFDGTTTRTVTTTAAYNTATWIKPEAVYTTDGTLAIRVNGAEVAATRGNPLLSLNSRYNLLEQSQSLASSPWANQLAVTPTNNAGIAPDSTNTATSIVFGSQYANRRQGLSTLAGVSYTISFWAKLISGNTALHILHENSASGGFTPFTATTSWARYSVTVFGASGGGGINFGIQDRNASGWGEVYIWGAQVEVGSLKTYQRVGAATDFDFAAPLTIGNSFAADAPFPGSISLLKLSATVPTAEQSQWMYEQEKQMFRTGAQVCLPDAGNVVDLAYDDATDKWLAVSATNESEWSGLVRTSATASPAGSYSKISAASGIQLQARTTTNPGVDITIPSYGLREELVNRSQAAARLARTLVSFDYVGGFTANTTTGSTAIASAAGITYPVSYIGARVTATGIPADTFVTAVSTTTIYLSKAATATATAVQISFSDFILPLGYETEDVLLAGVSQREGTTQAFVRLFDGFKETVRFNTSPLYTALVQIKATRSIQ